MKKLMAFFLAMVLLSGVSYAAVRSDAIIKRTDFNSGEVVIDFFPPYASDNNTFAAGGLKVGDRITAIGDKKINAPKDYYDALWNLKPGENVTFTVLRDGKEVSCVVNTAPVEFTFIYPIGQALRSGDNVKIAIAVTSALNDQAAPDPYITKGDLERTRGFWTNILNNVFKEMIKGEDYGAYTKQLSIVDVDAVAEAMKKYGDINSTQFTKADMDSISAATGANYLLAVDYITGVTPDGKNIKETIKINLISLAQGEVKDSSETAHFYDVDTGNRIKTTINGYDAK